ncbi:AarF/ABC1/UbiB kinase family protein [Conexibacter sp. SYSU D00693]|uniref:ABC1 kinase family protein n=1 Tax=Conexibacter sp. SYSU D00693 TaxID=2812560 RepID=UPI00196AFCE4|nr:AarF/ABC1/UbiB kinase family protein [Conexibacter sp. SYSU D00693]
MSPRLPTGRIRRTAAVGGALGAGGAAVAKARLRGDDEAEAHLEAAERMVKTLGTLRGAAMKIAQLASFVDVDLLPDEYRAIYQDQLAALRDSAPPMEWSRVKEVLEEAWGEAPERVLEDLEHDARAAASIGQVHRGVLPDGRAVAVKVQYPDVARALAADMQNAGLLMRMAKALAPGLDAKSAAAELKERVLEELDYELEAQKQRQFARAYRGHPFVVVPDVHTSLSAERVLVTEWVEDGIGFEEIRTTWSQEDKDRFGEVVFRFHLGSLHHIRHFNADAHPGNYLALGDGRVAFLDFGMTKHLDQAQIDLEVLAIRAALDDDPEGLRKALDDIGYLRKAERLDAELLMAHTRAVGGWYLEDTEVTIDARRVMKAIAAISDPRSKYAAIRRSQNLPADELMGQRMLLGVLGVLGRLEATRNWCAIGREWWFGEEPATELGVAERAFFAGR